MSQSQYNFNTFQSNPPTIYNQNSNQDVAYTQQQTFQTATQFQYQMPNQESVMMQMNPFQQSFNPVLTVNQNQPKLKSEDKELQNKQSAPKLPKLPKQKSSQKNSKMTTASSSSTKSDKMKIQEEEGEEQKMKLDSISTALNSDPLDLERNSGVPDFIKKLYR